MSLCFLRGATLRLGWSPGASKISFRVMGVLLFLRIWRCGAPTRWFFHVGPLGALGSVKWMSRLPFLKVTR